MATRRLLAGGVMGAALFVLVFTILAATRAQYDPVPHFISILSLGDGGWAQIANFVVGGVLIAGLGMALRRRHRLITRRDHRPRVRHPSRPRHR